MKRFLTLVVLLAHFPSLEAEEASPLLSPGRQVELTKRPLPSPQAPTAWLGMSLVKPSESITAQVAALPPGIGFLIKAVDADGPAAIAGLVEMDLIWKMGDQMLVNESQLGALLRLFTPGETVIFEGFRGGKPLEVKLKLGVAPQEPMPFSPDMVDATVLPGFAGPMRVIDVATKSASFAAEEGKVTVKREGEGFHVRIDGPQAGTIVFEGGLTRDNLLKPVPEIWRSRVQVLCRTLDQTLDGSMTTQRQPRPRVVPPATTKD